MHTCTYRSDGFIASLGFNGTFSTNMLLRAYNAEDTARSRLRSAARGDLQVPRSKTNFGNRAFAVAGPMFWNRLPKEIRANDSLQSFKSQLKTYYF